MSASVRTVELAHACAAQTANWHLLSPDDPAWERFFQALPLEQQDVFYTPGYAKLCARHLYPGHAVRCAVLETPSGLLLYPFVQRKIAAVTADPAVGANLQDLTGLYGRGGVVCSPEFSEEALSEFHRLFAQYCREQRIICGFDRYHPVLQNHRLAGPRTEVKETGGFVVVDLSPPLDELERGYEHALRKHLKKAERAGVEVFVEDHLGHLEEFMRVYGSTLDRRQAQSFYYVPRAWYEELPTRLPGRFRFFYATWRGRVVSCELVLSHGHSTHSFLGGTDATALEACPNHLLKRELIRDAKARGCQFYLLGGGQQPQDGIWRYKLCFAPQGNRPSLIGTTVFDDAGYAGLRQAMERSGRLVSSTRFQFYDPN